MTRPSGLTDLAQLLAALRPVVRPGNFVLISTTTHGHVPAEATVVEDEGTSMVLRKSTADAFRLEYDTVFCWITLTVHSSLTAVGLTGAVAGRLADAGIPCNVLAGFYHDHLLVPKKQVDDALLALAGLGTE